MPYVNEAVTLGESHDPRFHHSTGLDDRPRASAAELPVARAKVRRVLRDEDPVRLVLQYHATDAAENWATDLPADEALRYAVNRAARAVGVRIQTMATLGALSVLVEMSAGGVPGLLSPEVVENILATR